MQNGDERSLMIVFNGVGVTTGVCASADVSAAATAIPNSALPAAIFFDVFQFVTASRYISAPSDKSPKYCGAKLKIRRLSG